MSEHLPRFEIYRKLQSDPVLDTALLNVFTDIVEFSVNIHIYYGKSSIGKEIGEAYTVLLADCGWCIARLAIASLRPARDLFREQTGRLKKHSQRVDQMAVAVELLRASEFRDSKLLSSDTVSGCQRRWTCFCTLVRSARSI